MQSVWRTIMRAIGEGQDPVVELTYSANLWVGPRKKGGRKRKERPSLSFNLYSARPLGIHSRPRCWNPYCKKRLRPAVLVCDASCAELAEEHLTGALAILKNRDSASSIPDVPELGAVNALPGLPKAAVQHGGRAPRGTAERSRRIQQARTGKG